MSKLPSSTLPSLLNLSTDNKPRCIEVYPYWDDHVSVAFATNGVKGNFIRLIQDNRAIGLKYIMNPRSYLPKQYGDIETDGCWVRQVEGGVPYEYQIPTYGDTDRAHKKNPEETYNFKKINFEDQLSKELATIHVKVTVDVDEEELDWRRGTNDDESSHVEPETR